MNAHPDFVVLHPDPIRRVELALEDLRAGRPIILVDDEERPVLTLDANDYTRAVRAGRSVDPMEFTHHPITVTDPETPLDEVLTRLVVEAESFDDQLVDREVILYWGERSKRIITGPDLLGRLLHGIAQRRELPPMWRVAERSAFNSRGFSSRRPNISGDGVLGRVTDWPGG